MKWVQLYIFSFLHQTTTYAPVSEAGDRCISSLFYIKPQQPGGTPQPSRVVYLLFSTSNHNSGSLQPIIVALYIFSFLHQTTTCSDIIIVSFCCISSLFYIKPQQGTFLAYKRESCISSLFYIKPQLALRI